MIYMMKFGKMFREGNPSAEAGFQGAIRLHTHTYKIARSLKNLFITDI